MSQYLLAADPRERLLAPTAVTTADPDHVVVDVGALVRRLLLFDSYVLDSYGFREFPRLIEVIGTDGLTAMLDSGALYIRGDALILGEGLGMTANAALRADEYALGMMTSHDRRAHISNRLGVIRDLGLNIKESSRLRRAIVDRLVPVPMEVVDGTLGQLSRDLVTDHAVLRRAITASADKHLQRQIDPENLDVTVEQTGDKTWHVVTNLAARLEVPQSAAQDVVRRGLLALAAVHQRFAEMEAYGVVTGFRDEERPILDAQMRLLLDQFVGSEQQERAFERVVDLTDLPDIRQMTADYKLDVPELLRIRDSDEALAFRAWLRSTPGRPDAEIISLMDGLSERVARAMHGTRGKAARFVVSQGLQLLGPAGTAASASANFVLDKVLAKPGPVSFLSRLYPSIFRED